jgi:hypothetical protein
MILSAESDWPNGPLDRIRVDLDAAVVEKARQAFQCARMYGIASARPRDFQEPGFKPKPEGVDQRLRLSLADEATALSRSARMLASIA